MTEEHENEALRQATSGGRIGKIITLAVIVFLILMTILTNSLSKRPISDQVWDQEMTIGNLEAKNYYIMYTDIYCPYCDHFSRAVLQSWDDFVAYLEENDILFEIRLTDYLYEAKGIQISRDSAEGAYCAAREGKFWDYYHATTNSLWNDYRSKGYAINRTAPEIKDIADDYFLNIGKNVGLGDDFENCVNNHETVATIIENTEKSFREANGMPTFRFNTFVQSGFPENGTFEDVKMYLDAGLNS